MSALRFVLLVALAVVVPACFESDAIRACAQACKASDKPMASYSAAGGCVCGSTLPSQ